MRCGWCRGLEYKTHLDGESSSVVADRGASPPLWLGHLPSSASSDGSKIPDLPQGVEASSGIEALGKNLASKHVGDFNGYIKREKGMRWLAGVRVIDLLREYDIMSRVRKKGFLIGAVLPDVICIQLKRLY